MLYTVSQQGPFVELSNGQKSLVFQNDVAVKSTSDLFHKMSSFYAIWYLLGDMWVILLLIHETDGHVAANKPAEHLKVEL